MELLEEVTYPKPLGEPLLDALRVYRETHPWVRESDLSPKSVVRDMYEWGRTFTEFVAFYGLARSEGLVLRYLSTPTGRCARRCPRRSRPTSSTRSSSGSGRRSARPTRACSTSGRRSTDPESVARVAAAMAAGEASPPPRPITANTRAFTVMVRNAMFQKVQLASRDDAAGLAQLEAAAAALTDAPGRVAMGADAWEAALGAYWDEYESIGTGPDARSPELLMIDRNPPTPRRAIWTVRQIIEDPEANHDFAIVATVDLDASDAAGEPVIRTTSFGSAHLGS